jgi:CheY-like chemotaxis protein
MKRILIADDSLELGRLLQTVFLTLDPTLFIQAVPSAEEALLESNRKPIDLLVSDIRLPGMSGFDLVKRIRARHPDVKVLLISGLTDPSLAERVRQTNVEGFFRKPVDMPLFLAEARRCLDIPADSPLNVVQPQSLSASTPVSTTPMVNRESRSASAPSPSVPVTYPESRSASAPSPSIPLVSRELPISEPAPIPTVPATPSPRPAHGNLSDVVSGLRQRLGALAVFVLDERGRLVVQAGDVPSLPLEGQWVGPIMAALSAGAKVARLAGEEPLHHVMAFPGKDFHLVLAPAGDYALLALLRPGRSVLRMAIAVEEALEAQHILAKILIEMSPKQALEEQSSRSVIPPTSPLPPLSAEKAQSMPELSPEPEPALADFEALFKQAAPPSKDSDADAFWDTLTAGAQSGVVSNADMISYEQALQLGLTPQDEK